VRIPWKTAKLSCTKRDHPYLPISWEFLRTPSLYSDEFSIAATYMKKSQVEGRCVTDNTAGCLATTFHGTVYLFSDQLSSAACVPT
jgi:hypothetical protein